MDGTLAQIIEYLYAKEMESVQLRAQLDKLDKVVQAKDSEIEVQKENTKIEWQHKEDLKNRIRAYFKKIRGNE